MGAEATRAGFLVQLNPENGSVMNRFELMAAPQTVTVGADGAVYAGGQGFVLKLNAELQQVLFAADPGGTVVGLAVDPADGSVYTALAVGNEAFAAKLSADGFPMALPHFAGSRHAGSDRVGAPVDLCHRRLYRFDRFTAQECDPRGG